MIRVLLLREDRTAEWVWVTAEMAEDLWRLGKIVFKPKDRWV